MMDAAWGAVLPDGAQWRAMVLNILTGSKSSELGDEPVGRGPKGEPLWPIGLVGSITQASGWRALATAPADQVVALGIDMEPLIPMPPEVWPHFLDHDELDQLLTMPPPRRGLAALSRWCLKEALFKALAGGVPFDALSLFHSGEGWRPTPALRARLTGHGIDSTRLVMKTATTNNWQYAAAYLHEVQR